MGGDRFQTGPHPALVFETVRTALTRRHLSTILAGSTVAGCLSRSESAPNRGAPSPTERTDTDVSHPDLSPRLEHVLNAEDPRQYATENGYRVREDAILVVAELESGHSPPDALVESVENHYQTQYHVFVRFEDLLALTSADAVTSVRLPAQPATNAND